MKVRILFFGATADVARIREIQMEISNGESASSVFERVVNKYPTFLEHDLRFALNQQYASGNESVQDGDEIAVFTAVSGG